MFKKALEYFDFGFYLRFALIFLILYYGFMVVVSVSSPSGVYFPFVEKYLNFPVPLRDLVLHTSQALLSLLHYRTSLSGDQLSSPKGPTLGMAWPCLGFGVQSCWLAFICAHRMTFSRKAQWSTVGVLSIFFVNCIRVVLMMIAMVERWPISEYLGTNAHDLFNYICYVVLLLLVFIFYSRTKNDSTKKGSTINATKPQLSSHTSQT